MIIEIIKLSLIVLLVDSVFLFSIYKMFNEQVTKVQGSPIQVNIFGAIMSYIFIVLPLYWFIIKEKKSNIDAFILGISLYGLYEYTTLGVLKNWELKTTVIDILWGGILFLIFKNIYEKF